jgi:type I restriction enzyme S subunit
LLKVKDPAKVSTRFLYFLLRTQAKKYVSAGMGNPKLMAGDMGDIRIAIPSFEKQKEIVEVLDRFDLLLNDLSVGLPAELTARRKQYEYYRDKLLTFEESA